jgi:hypothetical protein
MPSRGPTSYCCQSCQLAPGPPGPFERKFAGIPRHAPRDTRIIYILQRMHSASAKGDAKDPTFETTALEAVPTVSHASNAPPSVLSRHSQQPAAAPVNRPVVGSNPVRGAKNLCSNFLRPPVNCLVVARLRNVARIGVISRFPYSPGSLETFRAQGQAGQIQAAMPPFSDALRTVHRRLTAHAGRRHSRIPFRIWIRRWQFRFLRCAHDPFFRKRATVASLACSRSIVAWVVSASALPVDCFPDARWRTSGLLAIFLRLPLLSRIIIMTAWSFRFF